MKISSNPPLHLSYHEVLSHFIELKGDNDFLQASITSQNVRRKAQSKRDYPLLRDKRDDGDEPEPELPELSTKEDELEKVAERRGISSSLIWVQDQVIDYLCSDFIPTTRQTPEGITLLADRLQDYDLTKAEVLQCCNSAPVSRVNLYAIIEEPETRFKPNPDPVLAAIQTLISSTLLEETPEHLLPYTPAYKTAAAEAAAEGGDGSAWQNGYDNALEEEAMMAQEYVTEPEWGAGKEGGVEEEKDGEIDS